MIHLFSSNPPTYLDFRICDAGGNTQATSLKTSNNVKREDVKAMHNYERVNVASEQVTVVKYCTPVGIKISGSNALNGFAHAGEDYLA